MDNTRHTHSMNETYHLDLRLAQVILEVPVGGQFGQKPLHSFHTEMLKGKLPVEGWCEWVMRTCMSIHASIHHPGCGCSFWRR